MQELTRRGKTLASHYRNHRYSGSLVQGDPESTLIWNDSRSGSDNPHWREQVKRNQQAATGFSGEIVEIVNRPFLMSAVHNRTSLTPPGNTYETSTIWGNSLPNIPLNVGSLSESLANNRALEQLVKKIRDAQTSFNGGTFVGEILQTVSLITRPAKLFRRGVGDFIDNLRGFRYRKDPNAMLRFARDRWLDYQLGWAPLLSDIDSGVETLANSRWASEYNRYRKVIRAVGIDESSTHFPNNTGYPGSSAFRLGTDVLTFNRVTVRYIASVDCGSFALSNMRRIGFDLSNFVPTLWELLPWSFVIDYFTNIGEIISAASLARSSCVWIVKTVRKEKEAVHINVHPIVPPPNQYGSFTVTSRIPGKTITRKRIVSREPYTGSLVPDLTFSLPNSGTKWLNIAALVSARQSFKSYYT